MDQNLLQKYAEALVTVGINLQKGDNVQVNMDSNCLELGRLVVRTCWEKGARDVFVNISDDDMALARFELAEDGVFDHFPAFKVDLGEALYKEHYHRISLRTPTLDLFAHVDKDRMRRSGMAANVALKPLDKYFDSGESKWVVASAASEKWAKLLFPELPAEDALDVLWAKIFTAARITADRDAAEAWQEHDRTLKRYERWLDGQQFRELHYTGPGTDLTVGIADGHKWIGGSSVTPDGIRYMANMPTEEIFTCPHKERINGRVQATKPLNNSGKIIENFWFEFKDGRVVDYGAEKGKEILDIQLGMDEGARSLGEVAIVPDSSPISRMNLVFRNTLFDENASCHFALGKAYSETIIGGEKMSEEELSSRGYNDSMIHIDFMVGGPELTITGTRKDGSVVKVLEGGEWAVKL